MYSDPFSSTAAAAAGIDDPGCVKWRETLPSQEESAGRDIPMRQLVTKVLVSSESPLPPCQLWPGHNSPVPRRWEPGPDRCPHPRVDCGWMIVVRTPRRKKLVAFGADEPDSSEPAKGLKEGVFQMWGEGCVCGDIFFLFSTNQSIYFCSFKRSRNVQHFEEALYLPANCSGWSAWGWTPIVVPQICTYTYFDLIESYCYHIEDFCIMKWLGGHDKIAYTRTARLMWTSDSPVNDYTQVPEHNPFAAYTSGSIASSCILFGSVYLYSCPFRPNSQ